ncbi:MAG TPA: hypothetical protein VI365_10480 [Trebonia sp.]
MSTVELISYRAKAVPGGIEISQNATSFRPPQLAYRWRQRLQPWLQAGSSKGCAYLDFGTESAFIRWQPTAVARLDWRSALVRVGQSAELTGSYALELPEPDGVGYGAGGAFRPGEAGPRHAEIEARARSAAAIAQLIPLLAHALVGDRRVTVPWVAGGIPEAAMWGLATIVRMLGDPLPVSYLTYAAGPVRDGDTPGLLVTFRPDATATLPPETGFIAVATEVARTFADDPAALLRSAMEHGVPAAADRSSRISRLLAMQSKGPGSPPPRGVAPHGQPGNVNQGETAPVSATHDGGVGSAVVNGSTMAAGQPGSAGAAVMCPVCLHEIPDWDALTYWSYTSDGDFEEIRIPPDANPVQRARHVHGAYVRCPSTRDDATAVHHYLPANYARFGPPVLLGFVGLTQSGKSHLLASMVGEIGKLGEQRIEVHPLDPAVHHQFVESSVRPLFARGEVLPGTPNEETTTFADAFIVQHGSAAARVVALFDVAGGVLADVHKKREFLWLANGLFFVVDPDHIKSSKAGDNTFTNVLGYVRERPDRDRVSAAIVLNKADKVRFDEPAVRWLHSADLTVDPESFLRESADVYGYLERLAPGVLTEPYKVCRKATLHVSSPTGGAQEGEDTGGKYPRGVTPLGVLRPLVAMLAMTGVLTGPEAERIGV